ncbi:hypothetical protein WQ57_13015 [Mesobacillus campisalis]|uniref:Uncharacterized protein n=1 Tax=Mesobacillus campisalis TaxID=1408103 RepID=A0A0M2SXD9_9BACI|nr:hypothetical protein WQ57_13015 [Mesobacillus campisalis]
MPAVTAEKNYHLKLKSLLGFGLVMNLDHYLPGSQDAARLTSLQFFINPAAAIAIIFFHLYTSPKKLFTLFYVSLL